MNGAFLKSNSQVLTVWHDGDSLTIAPDHPNYNRILEQVQTGNFAGLENLLNVAKAITEYSFGKITVRHGQVFYGTHEVKNTLVDRIISAMGKGEDYERFIKFLDKLLDNPSNNAVNQLYDFIKHYDLKISADGDFYTYKAITGAWLDKWTRTISNAVGAKPSMPRSMVCEDPNMCAGPGLHCGSIHYASGYGDRYSDRMIIVKVNPANVVSIPKDSDYQKCRTSGYEVVSECNWDGLPLGEFSFEKVGASTILRPEDAPPMNHGIETAVERVYDETPSESYVPDACEDREYEPEGASCCGNCGCADCECFDDEDDEDDEEFCPSCENFIDECDCEDDEDDEECDCDECQAQLEELDDDEDEEPEVPNLCDECDCPIADDADLCDPCDAAVQAELCASQPGDEPEFTEAELNEAVAPCVPVKPEPEKCEAPQDTPTKKSWWRNLGW